MKPSDTSTMQEVCEQLKCGRKRLYALIREEGFPQYARVGRKNFFYDDAITAWRRSRPDLFPPACYADSDSLPDGDALDPSMEKMYKQVQAEKQAQAVADREREEREKELAKLAAQERAEIAEREQRKLWQALAPRPEPTPLPTATRAAPDNRKSVLNQRKVKAALKANRAKLRKGK